MKFSCSPFNQITRSILVLVLCPLVLSAQPKWKDLFNGKDLSGWKRLGGKARFEVVGNEIIGTSVVKEPSSFLATEEVFGDFILEMQFKIDEGANSGIQFRSETKPDYKEGRVFGYQYEIDPSARAWTGGIYDESRREWLYTLDYNIEAKRDFEHNEWNLARIECIGNTLRTFINGFPAAQVVDNLTSKGFIALQIHSVNKEADAGKQIHWRNIRIQTEDLKPAPYDHIFVANFIPNTISEQEKLNGVTLLWDGKTTTGWRGVYKDKFPDKGWEIKDGELRVVKSATGESPTGGDIVTTNEYGAFDLQFEFKIEEGANSGVKYFAVEKDEYKGAAIGLEYQILDDEKHPDAKAGVVGNRTQGSLYDLIPALKITRGLHKIGEWNYGSIVVFADNHIEHWLNGYKVVEYQRGTPIYNALVARSKYAQWKDFGMAPKGHILLQDHGHQVSFRSIKIQEFKP